MWRVVDKLDNDDDCRPYFNETSTVKGYTPAYLIGHQGHVKSDILRKAFPHQEESFEYEGCEILRLEQKLVPFALKIDNEGNSDSAIVKVYGGMETETNGSSTTKWYLLYKKNGDVSNNSELNLVNPDMNCERMMNVIGIQYDYKNLTKPLSPAKVTCFGPNTVQLQTVENNDEILNISSKAETKKKKKKKRKRKNKDYFSILPNELIAKIFGYFDLKTLARTAQVSCRFNEIITKTDAFYYNLDFRPYWNVMSADVLDRFMDKTKSLKKLDLLEWNYTYPCQNAVFDLKLEDFLNGAKNTLTHLYIDKHGFDPKDSLIKAIFACKELLELHLRHIDLKLYSNSGWFKADIIQCKNLRKLDLSFCHINYTELITIISKTRNLKHLILDSINIYGEGGRFVNLDNILEKSIKFDINLETWSTLGSNYDIHRLSLFRFHTNLEELDLTCCRCWRGNDLPPTFTFSFLAKCSRLKRLRLAGWMGMEDNHLVTVIENCKKLEQVDISLLTSITANSIKKFLKLENLKLLDISHCTHQTISSSQIAKWRKEYPQIKFII